MDESVPPNVTSFSTRDLQFIVKFHTDFAEHQFRHLVHALCPSIYGHELEKVCLISPLPLHTECMLQPKKGANLQGNATLPVATCVQSRVRGLPCMCQSFHDMALESSAPCE